MERVSVVQTTEVRVMGKLSFPSVAIGSKKEKEKRKFSSKEYAIVFSSVRACVAGFKIIVHPIVNIILECRRNGSKQHVIFCFAANTPVFSSQYSFSA